MALALALALVLVLALTLALALALALATGTLWSRQDQAQINVLVSTLAELTSPILFFLPSKH